MTTSRDHTQWERSLWLQSHREEAKERAIALANEITLVLERHNIESDTEISDNAVYITFETGGAPYLFHLSFGKRTIIHVSINTLILPISLENAKQFIEKITSRGES